MKELTRQELIDVNVSIIKDIHNFCETHGIKYSLGYGSLIGAIRHKGFIPWDDDADLVMPRPDYERFIKTYKSSQFTLLSCTTSNYELPFARVSDESTLKVEETTVWKDTGVAVDIYPVDGKVPTGDIILERKVSLLKTLIRVKSTVAVKKGRGFVKNLIMCIMKILTAALSLNYLCRRLDKTIQKHKYYESKFAGSYLSPYNRKDCCETSCFEDYINVEFEGERFKCLKGFDQYLSNLYGDYMTPPSNADRASTHGSKFYKK